MIKPPPAEGFLHLAGCYGGIFVYHGKDPAIIYQTSVSPETVASWLLVLSCHPADIMAVSLGNYSQSYEDLKKKEAEIDMFISAVKLGLLTL